MRRLLIALSLAVAVIGFAPVAATAAGGYCTGSGVNVVVGYGALGGGNVKGCGGTAGTAADAFGNAHFTLLAGNPRMGSTFICTVDGKPANGHCTGANGDGYWALYIADAGGSWSYASQGADTQPVSSGQSVAFVWQPPNAKVTPAVAPAAAARSTAPAHKTKPSPAPKATSSAMPSSSSKASTSASASPSATTTSASATAKARKHHHAKASVVASPTSTPSTAAVAGSAVSPTSDTTSSSHSGLPWWVPAGVVVLLAAGGGGVWWTRVRGSKGR